MTEEMNQNQDADQKSIKNTTPKIISRGNKRPSKLTLLPPEAIKEIDSLLLTGHGAKSIKTAIESRYLDKAPGILPADVFTYQCYINVRREQLNHQAVLQNSLIESTKDGLTDVRGVINVLTETSLENKKKAFENIYRKIEARISLLEQVQNAGFVNSQLESVLGAYIREQRTIIEKLITLRADLEKDSTEQVYNEFENLVYAWFVVVLTVYKNLHGEEKITEFKSILKEELSKVLENYRMNKKQK